MLTVTSEHVLLDARCRVINTQTFSREMMKTQSAGAAAAAEPGDDDESNASDTTSAQLAASG
jgi:hypothetical protein